MWYWSITHWIYDFYWKSWTKVWVSPVFRDNVVGAMNQQEDSLDDSPNANTSLMSWWDGKKWVSYSQMGPYQGM